ncbi:hypothetical protein GCM10010341_67610 [Streptomyces noursei]|nr:hypothetical protein GCM10010341_67610 [Streptomyces noursei]
MITRDLSSRAQQLHAAGTDRLPLGAVLEVTERVREDAECLAAVAVDSARRVGWAWRDVASAAGISEASARARWGGVRVSRLVSARVPLSSARPAQQDQPPQAICTEPDLQSTLQGACEAAQDPGTADGERWT